MCESQGGNTKHQKGANLCCTHPSLRRLERHAGVGENDQDNLGVDSRSTSRVGTPYDPLSSSDEDENSPGAQRTREDVVREALYYQRKLEGEFPHQSLDWLEIAS